MAKWISFKRQDSETVEIGTVAGDTDQRQVTVYQGDMFDTPVATDETIAESELEVQTPCWPGKMIGLWNNVRAAAEKKELGIPEEPLYFLKTSNCYLPHGGEIQRPDYYDGRIIYEGELGIVIGKTCRNVSVDQAGDYIFGATAVNDVTALTLIDKDPTFAQWCRAKNMDTFGAFGPTIETDIDVDQLSIRTIYRNKEMQNYPVSDLIFSPREIISLLSQDMTLNPGDLIACGTGDGVLPIRPGTTVEVHIDGLDVLSNTMAPKK